MTQENVNSAFWSLQLENALTKIGFWSMHPSRCQINFILPKLLDRGKFEI